MGGALAGNLWDWIPGKAISNPGKIDKPEDSFRREPGRQTNEQGKSIRLGKWRHAVAKDAKSSYGGKFFHETRRDGASFDNCLACRNLFLHVHPAGQPTRSEKKNENSTKTKTPSPIDDGRNKSAKPVFDNTRYPETTKDESREHGRYVAWEMGCTNTPGFVSGGYRWNVDDERCTDVAPLFPRHRTRRVAICNVGRDFAASRLTEWVESNQDRSLSLSWKRDESLQSGGRKVKCQGPPIGFRDRRVSFSCVGDCNLHWIFHLVLASAFLFIQPSSTVHLRCSLAVNTLGQWLEELGQRCSEEREAIAEVPGWW